MLEPMRTLRPTATRGLLTALLAASLAAFPGAGAPAHAESADDAPRLVIAGHVLRPRPPAFVLPVRGYHLTGRFGDTSYHWHTAHTGLDFAAASGTGIRAVGSGVIVSASYDGRYGNKTVLRLNDGTEIWFCHQTSFTVGAGERVRAGQLIGYVGSTGNVTGPHLHLEVHPAAGAPVDPAAWLRNRGVRV